MFDLSDNSALVTGASGGIGASIARALHARGATVVLHGTRAERPAALAAERGERADGGPPNPSGRGEAAGRGGDAAGGAAPFGVTGLTAPLGFAGASVVMQPPPGGPPEAVGRRAEARARCEGPPRRGACKARPPRQPPSSDAPR